MTHDTEVQVHDPDPPARKRGGPLNSPWRSEAICNLVKELWAKHSAAEISDILAREKLAQVSRNAVVGFLHREQQTIEQKTSVHPSTRDNGIPRVKSTSVNMPGVNRARLAPRVKPIPFIVSADDIIPLRIELLELDATHCRYPYDAVEGETGSFVFCGHQTFGNGSWCPGHAKLVHRPPPSRKAPPAPLNVAAAPSRFGGGRAA